MLCYYLIVHCCVSSCRHLALTSRIVKSKASINPTRTRLMSCCLATIVTCAVFEHSHTVRAVTRRANR